MTDATPTRRPFRPTPAWLIFGSLVVEGLLWLSERLQWPSWHKGYAVLIASRSLAVSPNAPNAVSPSAPRNPAPARAAAGGKGGGRDADETPMSNHVSYRADLAGDLISSSHSEYARNGFAKPMSAR